ncbi:MAG TPA: WecB/TagA/CpsF family glycosyltransferase [Syntrophothermus lipocalidus]|uniref:N-acetylglucosaminyldiphosphoundecaprenol N-acetyl-beta-D-mannosaminyltransferase n=1 Tax=Syntrophothermus lipocalidus (strain DSM 12680 / TGB-C1) TaxID=643648 RepID=D7CJQ9_SYNLT|nr:WecB/TagA/CpsF family glycosyltransferase [Syntrophothermus lipocalidus]ADI03014.1 glycosyl transferase, WecB/TagA/CpsF family [Syntrophothermus lipocalidus DSM 12680]HHV76294.1 WecB/TagA/CpsF family glycosyltransferase [Syntrophothermus lipocalidus]HOV42682.1 WecB/TagA/CpsF family glycosyltransferase [Syntrophothermus lipocalidus]
MRAKEIGFDQAYILGCRLDLVDMEQSLSVIKRFVEERTPHQVVTANAEMVYAASRQKPLRDIINRAHLVTLDGAGVVWAARFLGHRARERVTGIDLTLALAELASKLRWRLYLLGAKPGVAEEAAARMVARFPGLEIVGTHHGYFQQQETAEVVREIKEAKPDLLLVALGAPYQEFWINRHLAELGVPVALGIGGSLDVLSGQVKRAPKLFIRLNLEWLYRLVTEPRRWRRQLALPRFVFAVWRQKLGLFRLEP